MESPLINMDETPLQVLKEPGRANTTKSYMRVFCGGAPDNPTVLYRYHPTRSGEVALKFLDDYKGFFQIDEYNGYNYLGNKPSIGTWVVGRMPGVSFSMWLKSEKSIAVRQRLPFSL